MVGRGGNEKNRGGRRRKRNTGILFAICMYTCVAFGHIHKKLPPSPLPCAERKHGDRRRAQGRRRRRRRSPSKRWRRRHRRLVDGAVVAVEDELGAAVGQTGDQRGCDEAEHRKEGLRPSGLVGGGGRLRRRPRTVRVVVAAPAVPRAIPLPGCRVPPPPQRGIPITTIPVLLLAPALLLLLEAYPTPEEGANEQIRIPLEGLRETHDIDLEQPLETMRASTRRALDRACSE